jgi:hypothetical protein
MNSGAESHRLQLDPNPEIGCRLDELRKAPEETPFYAEPTIQITRKKLVTRTAKPQISQFFRRLRPE